MKNFLIADDHEVTRRGVIDILRDEFGDVFVAEACDVPSLLGMLENAPWDLVLLDAIMPGGTVVDSIRSIRSRRPQLPILVLTAITEIGYVTESLRAGAQGLIHKNRAVDELVSAIRTVAGGGTYLHAETAVAVASSLQPEAASASPHEALSERELHIFRRIALGLAVKEVAGELGISDKTVATYLARIRKKTGLQSHVEIARYALQHGLVD